MRCEVLVPGIYKVTLQQHYYCNVVHVGTVEFLVIFQFFFDVIHYSSSMIQ